MSELLEQNRAIARRWRERVWVEGDWAPAANHAGAVRGLSRGRFVASAGLANRRAYMKPTTNEPGCAAREKIASDLAFDLGVSVPPAVLYRRNDVAAGGECQEVVLTLVLYPRQYSWEVIRPDKTAYFLPEIDALIRGSGPAIALARAFDTWVEQPDHGDRLPTHNIIVGYEPARLVDARLIFLDYALALGAGGAWTQAALGGPGCSPAPFPASLARVIGRQDLDEAITKIERLEAGTIGEIVHRIPGDFLLAHEADTIERVLLERQQQLRDILFDADEVK